MDSKYFEMKAMVSFVVEPSVDNVEELLAQLSDPEQKGRFIWQLRVYDREKHKLYPGVKMMHIHPKEKLAENGKEIMEDYDNTRMEFKYIEDIDEKRKIIESWVTEFHTTVN